MAYILLIAGIICIFLGIKGFRTGNSEYMDSEKKNAGMGQEQKKNENTGKFSGYLENTMLLQKLNSMEEKIEWLCSMEESRQDAAAHQGGTADNYKDDMQMDLFIDDVSGINKQVLNMKNQGMTVEEIGVKLGMTKGEVLLRLGMGK